MSHRYVLVDLDNGDAVSITASTYFVDVEALDDESRGVLDDAAYFAHYSTDNSRRVVEQFGADGPGLMSIVERFARVLDPTRALAALPWATLSQLERVSSMLEAGVELVDDPRVEAVRVAVLDDLRRLFHILDDIALDDLTTAQVADWVDDIEGRPSGVLGALEAFGADDRLSLEDRVRAEVLEGGTVDEWARREGYRRTGGLLWVDEYGDHVDIGAELDDEVRRVCDGLEALGGES